MTSNLITKAEQKRDLNAPGHKEREERESDREREEERVQNNLRASLHSVYLKVRIVARL